MTVALKAKKRKLVMTAVPSNPWVIERDKTMIIGESIRYAIKTPGNAISSLAYFTVYLNGAGVAVTSGSSSIGGNTVNLLIITPDSDHGGKNYVVAAGIGSDVDVRRSKFFIRVLKNGDEKIGELYEDLWVTEPIQVMAEGDYITFTVEFLGADIVSGVSSKVYKNGNEYSSVQSGSDSLSGNVVTLQKITAGSSDAGSVYVVEVTATVDNNTEIRKFMIKVVGPDEE